jgi:hypothetical protein
LYEELCDDGQKLYLKDVFGDLSTTHMPRYEQIDYRYFEPDLRQITPPQQRSHPFRVETQYQIVSGDEWDGVVQKEPNTIHVENAYFVVLETPVTHGGNNLWHFSQSTMMLLDPQFHNETGMYPPMDTIVIRALGELGAWNKGLLDLLLPNNHTRVIIMQPGERVCSKTAVLMGYRRGLISGQQDGTLFRERAYSRLGLDIRPKQSEELAYPLRVRLFNREGSRHMTSPTEDEVRAMLVQDGGSEAYDFKTIQDFSHLPFATQVELWANADLIIMPHGAGLTNMIFARNHVPVIEVFPRHFYIEMYRSVAANTNHPYFALMSERLPSTDYHANPIDEINCEYWHGIDIMNEAHCHHQYLKHSYITVDKAKLQSTIKLALEALPLVAFPANRVAKDPIRPKNDPWGKPGK